jgi:hypothetical protein
VDLLVDGLSVVDSGGLDSLSLDDGLDCGLAAKYHDEKQVGETERSAAHLGTHVNTHEHHHIHETSKS